jgi:hypothetical protein
MSTRWMVAAALAAAAAVATAKLPPPSPEQAQAAAAKKEQEQAQLEKEKQLLEQAQDRVAERYRRTKGLANAPSGERAGRVEDHNLPKTVKELPRDTGPQGGRKQSAEAHSTPAR